MVKNFSGVTIAAVFFTVIMAAYVLVIGKNLIIPFIIALVIWQLLNTIATGIQKIPTLGNHIPRWISMVFAVIVLWFLTSQIVGIISDNITAVINASPRYQAKLLELCAKFHIDVKSFFIGEDWLQQLDVKNIALSMYSVVSTVTGNAVLIILYIIFLFFEQQVLSDKLQALFVKASSRRLVENIVHYIVHDTQVYLGIKTFTSFLTAFLSWLIMQWLGLDFAEFWALLIFFLNFIPSIGAIVATIFPALLALLQFGELGPFLEVTLGISLVQFSIGSFIEPRLMGYTLNLSPLVILIALSVWGSLWGVIGMFLSVPITVTMIIVFSHFEKTRGIAVLLSRDGSVKERGNT